VLSSLIRQSIRFRGIVAIGALLLMAAGAWQAARAPLDVFPDFTQPQVTLQTESPGLNPEEVEALVTFPIESAVSGIPGMESVRSQSIAGLSVVTVTFKQGTDIFADRQLLNEKLAELAGNLPAGVRAPSVSPLVSATMDLLKIGLVSEKISPEELRTLADWKLRPLLLAVPGVADISVVGGEVRELHVKVDAEKLVRRQISLMEITDAVRNASALRGVGYVETQNQRIPIAAKGAATDSEKLAGTVVRGAGADSILLGDVAEVAYGAAPKFGEALIQGEPGVMLALISQYGTNTLEVTQAVEAALAEFKPVLEARGITLYPALHRPANFIEIALTHIRESLLIGTALVMIVLVLFLLDLRTALISFISIPLSLLTTVLIFRAFGVTLNTLTLGGFAVAIGVVVDDAIIDVENIVRRLRVNAALAKPLAVSEVILDASVEVRGAVVYATLIVLAVFIPVFAMSGIQAAFFRPLGTAFALATLVSLGVAVTVTPALCAIFLKATGGHKEPVHIRSIKRIYGAILGVLMRVPVGMALVSLLLLGAALALVPGLKTEFLPDFREGHFVIQLGAAPGTSLTEMTRLGEKVSKELLEMPEVATVELQIGRSERGVDTFGPELGEIHLELKQVAGLDEAAIQEEIRELMEGYPGLQSEVLTFLGDRISETISGETAAIVISLFGEDLDALDVMARKMGGILSGVPGAKDVVVQSSVKSPELMVGLIPEEMTRYGLQQGPVLDVIQAACQGTEAAQIYEGNQSVSVKVGLGGSFMTDPEALAEIPVTAPGGTTVFLGDVARIDFTESRPAINHDAFRRRQVITANAAGRSVSEVVADARKAFSEKMTLDAGMHFAITGTAEAEAQATNDLMVSSGAAAVIVLVLLWMVFRSARNLVLVLANLPFCLVGGIVTVWLTGQPLSLGALVGFITLFGISTRNAIMMVSHYEHLVVSENHAWNHETAMRGATERLVPVLMTALVTSLALLPLALHPKTSGQEIEGAMAIVIVGGLVSSTVLTLLVLPALALRFARFRRVG